MKLNLKHYPVFILLVGVLLGTMPAALYGLFAVSRLQPPTPQSEWDSRPCLSFPSPQTCNGILPYMPQSATTVSNQSGSGLCIDANATHSTQYITDNHSQSLAVLELWQSSTCRTSFAHIQTSGGIYSTLTIEIITYPTHRSRWAEANYTVTYTSISKISNAMWSVMVYTPNDATTSSCGYLLYQGKSYGECIEDPIE
jgi:hypothetical protein